MSFDWRLSSALSALTISVANIITRKQTKISSSILTVFWKNVFIVLLLLPFVFSDISSVSFLKKSPIFLIVGIISFFSVLTFTNALKISMAKTSLSLPLGFITLTTSGVIFLHEASSLSSDPKLIISFVLAMIGMYIMVRSSHSQNKSNQTKWMIQLGLNLLFLNLNMIISKNIVSEISPVILVFMNALVGSIAGLITLYRRKTKLGLNKKVIALSTSNALFTIAGSILYFASMINTELSKIVMIRTPLLAIFSIVWTILLTKEKGVLNFNNIIGGAVILGGLVFSL